MGDLLPWQKPFADAKLAAWEEYPYVADTSSVGAGKTYTACDVFKRRGRKVLVIAPSSVHTSWKKVARFIGCDHLLLDIKSPQSVSRQLSPWYKGNKWHLPEDSDVCVDEAHAGCSGPDSMFSLAVAKLKVFKIPAMIMSATLGSSPLQLRALGFLLGEHPWAEPGYYDWCRRNGCFYVLRNVMTKTGPRTVQTIEFPTGPKGKQFMAAIHERIKDKMVRVRTEDIPDFPHGVVESRLFDFKTDERVDMNKAYAEMSERMKTVHTATLVEVQRTLERVEWAKASLMASLAKDAVEAGQSCVIFMNFRSVLGRVSEMLNGLPFESIYGGQDMAERDQAIERFQENKTHIMLAMSAAGGVGISLHDVKQERQRVTYITPGFNASQVVQLLGRVRRVGGSPVVQTFVMAAGTAEEKVHERLTAKIANIDSLQDGDMER